MNREPPVWLSRGVDKQLRPRDQSLGQDPKSVGILPPAGQGLLQDLQPQ